MLYLFRFINIATIADLCVQYIKYGGNEINFKNTSYNIAQFRFL